MSEACCNAPADIHPAFEWLRSERIESLNSTVEEYRHCKTGAMHYHLAADNAENVFLVALRTVPHDSTGVAHILEHTALCGSKKYPVRDPFFMMIRRSLNTFMNAFTSSDWTAYPFASQIRKDFDNLLDVYLDAVFFSRIDPLDFAQEGHRVEFAVADDPNSELVFKGVVFNEMKGAMSSVPSTLWQEMTKYLFPSTTYHYNSGGDPECIPDLSYQELRAFYQTHYHPSNAIFMTYGNIPVKEHHAKFEAQALCHFELLDEKIFVPDEKRYHAPIVVEEYYASETDGDTAAKTHIVLGWLLGKNTNLEESLKAHLLSSVLLDNSASPLQKALETTDLGSAPSPLCGLEDSNREIVFICGIEGSEPDKAQALQDLVLNVIEDVANNGVPQEQVEAVLHQLELHQREIGGDSYPYGLQLILAGLSAATHRGDPIAALNLEPAIKKLREEINDPDFIKNLARKLLLENNHRVRLTMKPDPKLSEKRDAAEAARLAAIKAEMSDDEKSIIVKLAKALEDRQNKKDDESILPKVGLEDIPHSIPIPVGRATAVAAVPATVYDKGTNGIVYEQIIIQMPELDNELLEVMPIYTNCLTELGVGEADYLETQKRQSRVCGNISAFSSMRGNTDNEQKVKSHIIISTKALNRNYTAASELLRDTYQAVRFDELSRIKELISQMRARRESSITGNGHGLAMTAASAGMSPVAQLSHDLSGLKGIQYIKDLDDKLSDEAELKKLAAKLQNIHHRLLKSPKQFLLVGEEEKTPAFIAELDALWNSTTASNDDNIPGFNPKEIRTQVKQVWSTNTQVNFCAKAYPTVPVDHADAAPLSVLGGFLRNGYLHRAIREQGGAYGSGASQDSNIAAFRFFSYRDPRLTETLNDFDKSIEWLHSEEHDFDQLEQAILGVISSIDKPSSPAGDAKSAFHNSLYGRTPEQRLEFRNRILAVTLADLKRVALTYFKAEKCSTAVVTNTAGLEKFDANEYEVCVL